MAKEVFELCGVDSLGRTVLKKRLRRKELAVFMANLPPCRVAMEACGGAHYWARLFTSQGHHAQLIAAQFVKPFKNTRQKNDQIDVAAIVEAAQRPTMRYVAVKNEFQQDVQSLHRARELVSNTRKRFGSQIRGLMMEYGVVLPEGVAGFRKEFRAAVEDANNAMTPMIRDLCLSQYELFKQFLAEELKLESTIKKFLKGNEDYGRLLDVPGVGPLTASLFLASVGHASVFKNGRHLAAWLGLVPLQNSYGGTERLGRITKSGDSHLRVLMVQGARSAVLAAVSKQKSDPLSKWMIRLKDEKGWNKAAVAVANRNARVMWHLLKYQEAYRAA